MITLYTIFNIFLLAIVILYIQLFIFRYGLYCPPMSTRLRRKYLIGSFISVILVLIFTNILSLDVGRVSNLYIAQFINMFYNVAYYEELFKLIGFLGIYIISDKKEHSPIKIVYGMVIIALGFAFIENILYALASPNPINLLINRSFISTFVHVVLAMIIGYGLAISLNNTKHFLYNFFIILKYFTIAVLIHGMYDYLLYMFNTNWWNIIIIAVMIITSYNLILTKIMININGKN